MGSGHPYFPLPTSQRPLPTPWLLMPHTLFISDLHLSSDHPSTMAVFLRFIDAQAAQAEALYILGDLFDYWAGDDDLHTPFHQQVIRALHSLPNTRIHLMHGNRDLLMGETLADALGAELLNDPALIDLYGTPTLLSHGDLLCTDDVDYQRFRNQVHTTDFKQAFLARPLTERRAYIEQLRMQSDVEKKNKSSAIMDVNDNTVASLLRQYHYPRLIHGHTHRPSRHSHAVDGQVCERWVLGDWDTRANALRADRNGLHWVYPTV